MNTSIDRHSSEWKGYKNVGKNRVVARDDLQALHLEYDNYLLQRLSDPAPYLTFKKYLASKKLGFLCDAYDAIRFSNGTLGGQKAVGNLRISGTIEYSALLGFGYAQQVNGFSACCNTPEYCY